MNIFNELTQDASTLSRDVLENELPGTAGRDMCRNSLSIPFNNNKNWHPGKQQLLFLNSHSHSEEAHFILADEVSVLYSMYCVISHWHTLPTSPLLTKLSPPKTFLMPCLRNQKPKKSQMLKEKIN